VYDQKLPHRDPFYYHRTGDISRRYWVSGWCIQVLWHHAEDREMMEEELPHYNWDSLRSWERAALLFALGNHFSQGKAHDPWKQHPNYEESRRLPYDIDVATRAIGEIYI